MNRWIQAARLRTLPLSLATILAGNALAIEKPQFTWLVLVLTIATTVCLQILSNFANDYGDYANGADNEHRIGPERAVASGHISAHEMKKAVIITALLSLVFGLTLLYVSFGSLLHYKLLLFFVLGLGAIAAAIKYTAGKNPYGYRGYGDVFVFVFFGLVGVVGSCYLQTHFLEFTQILLAICMGSLATAVLNINNLRDETTDKATGKNTLIVMNGQEWGKRYQASLYIMAVVCYLVSIIKSPNYFDDCIGIVLAILLWFSYKRIVSTTNPDPELKKLALTSFGFSFILFLLKAIDVA